MDLTPIIGKSEQSLRSLQGTIELAQELADLGKQLIQQRPVPDLPASSTLILQDGWAAYARSLECRTDENEQAVLNFGTSLARLCRNLLAGNGSNKRIIGSAEPHIRKTIFLATNFGAIEDNSYLPLQRALVQVLSNLVAPVNEDTFEQEQALQLLRIYTNQDARQDLVLTRSFDSSDSQISLGVLTFLINALRCSSQCSSLVYSSPVGIRLSAKLMDKVIDWLQSEPGSIEERCFDRSYEWFSCLVDAHLDGQMFASLRSPDESISPSQLTLLKLLDGHLQTPHEPTHLVHDITYLTPALTSCAQHAVDSMRTIMSAEASQTPTTIKEDPILPRIFEACILLCKCFTTTSLGETPAEHERELLAKQYIFPDAHSESSKVLSVLRSQEHRVVEGLVELLGTAEQFLPRSKPLQASHPSAIDPDSKAIAVTGSLTSRSEYRTSLLAFATLKRDIIQLIGVMVYNNKLCQDRVREAGGVQLILSMCVADEHNPLIREYALLTIRNLMTNNPENQAVVGDMDPIGVVGEDGELKDLPPHMSKA